MEVRTQAELDIALTKNEVIDCVAGVLRAIVSGTSRPWIRIFSKCEFSIVARDSSSPKIEAWESSSPKIEARGSSSPNITAWGSSSPKI